MRMVTDVLREGSAPLSGSSNPRRVTGLVGLFDPEHKSIVIFPTAVT